MKYILFFLLLPLVSAAQTKIRSQSSSSVYVNFTNMPAITNTTIETTVYRDTVKAAEFGLSKELNIEFWSTVTTALLTVPAATIKFKFGTDSLVCLNAITLGLNQSDKLMGMKVKVANLNDGSSQYVMSSIVQGGSNVLLATSSTSVDAYKVMTQATSGMDIPMSITIRYSIALAGTTITPLYCKRKID